MKLPEFNLERYNSNDTEQHRIKILSEYLLECVKNSGDNFDDLSLLDDFQFEDFYSETVASVKRYYFNLYNWDYEKEKLMKSLTMSIARTKDLIKSVEFPNENWEQTEEEILAEVEEDEVQLNLLQKTYSKIKWIYGCQYDAQIDNYRKPRERKKLGYKVFVEFKQLIREFNSVIIPENDYSGKNELLPKEKLIVLDKLGIINFLTDKLYYSDNATHLAEILGAITGIDNQKGTLTGYCNYLIRSDPYNKNSPYYSDKTKERVNEIYNKFKIKNKTD